MGFQKVSPCPSAQGIGMERQRAVTLLPALPVWLWLAPAHTVTFPLLGAGRMEELNGGRTRPYPESFIRYVSYVHASIMQQAEK